jgi:hypothetical protein
MRTSSVLPDLLGLALGLSLLWPLLLMADARLEGGLPAPPMTLLTGAVLLYAIQKVVFDPLFERITRRVAEVLPPVRVERSRLGAFFVAGGVALVLAMIGMFLLFGWVLVHGLR